MRKIVLIAIILVTLIAASGRSISTAQESVRLRVHSFYGGSTHGLWDRQMVADYQADHDGIRIDYSATNLYSAPVPLRELNRNMTDESPPDVFMGTINGAMLREFAREGLVADISDLWAEQGWYDLYPQSVIDMATVDGKQYFVPMGFQWNPIFYRTDVFQAHDLSIPETWDDLMAVCAVLNGDGIRPFTVSGSGWTPPIARWFTMLNLRINGPAFHDALMDGEVSWQDERVVDVFDHWREAFEHGCFGETVYALNYGAAVQELVGGDAAMYLLGEWLYESFNEGDDEGIDFFKFPAINEEYADAAIVHYYGAWLHANTDNPDEARAFLSYLGSPELQTSIVEDLGRAVMLSSVPDDVLPEYQQKGRRFVEESDALTPLFEVSPFAHAVAVEGLSRFQGFIQLWDEADIIERVTERMEEVRTEQLSFEEDS